jgi:ubiquinol-cytochrome c reductase subunit 9
MSSLGGRIYTLFFKKSSTYFVSLVAGVFLFETAADQGANYIFDSINRGKQWKDIKHLYANQVEAAEDAE